MRLLTGIVLSNKMDKTVVAITIKKTKHKKYKKYLKKTIKYFVHDENNSCKINDSITFKEVAQISKKKKWNLFSIL